MLVLTNRCELYAPEERYPCMQVVPVRLQLARKTFGGGAFQSH
jgi:hypothetical protein